MEPEISSYNPKSSVLFIVIGSNHKNNNPGTPDYEQKRSIIPLLSPHVGIYLKQIRNEIRESLGSVIWQKKAASELRMNENLVRGPEFGGSDPGARYLPSILRFNGRFFNEGGIGKEGIQSILGSGHHTLIMDGLHGVTIPSEPVQLFNCPLEAETLDIQKRWRDQNVLTDVLLDYIRGNRIRCIIDLTARTFYRDLIDWYEIGKSGIKVHHVFFKEYAGNESITELAQLCRKTLFRMSESEILSIQPDSIQPTSEGDYIFSAEPRPPSGWAVEPAGFFIDDTDWDKPEKANARLNAMVDEFERNIRDFLDWKLVNIKDWASMFEGENIQDNPKMRLKDYLRKYPMISEKELNVLDFCTVNDYKRIIKEFWRDIFEPVFRSDSELKKHIGNITELRNSLKHNRQIPPSTQKIGEGSLIWFQEIFRKYRTEGD